MSDKMPLLFSIIITIMKLWKAIYRYSKVVEVLVIGGGHAGCQAAYISAKSGV